MTKWFLRGFVMAFWRGQGGAVTITTANSALPAGKWTVEESAALANVTNAKSAGHKQRKGTVRDTSFTVEMPWDDDYEPGDIGYEPGTEVKLVLNKGESGKKMTSTSCVIEKIGWTNDEDEDVVRLVISGYSNEKFVHS